MATCRHAVFRFAKAKTSERRMNSGCADMKKVMIAVLSVALMAAGDVPAKREAGNWKLDRTLLTFDMPGMPPEVRDRMVKMMGNNPSQHRCLTQELLDKEDTFAELTGRTTSGGKCEWSKTSIAKGQVDIAGACTSNNQVFDMTIVGTALPEKTDIVVTMDGKSPVGKVVLSMTDVRTGPCVADATEGT